MVTLHGLYLSSETLTLLKKFHWRTRIIRSDENVIPSFFNPELAFRVRLGARRMGSNY